MKVPKHKHELKEDKFITSVFLTSEFVKNHWKKLSSGVAGIVIILIIILGINSHRKSTQKEALTQFDIAFGYFLDKDYEKAEEEFTTLSEDFSTAKEHKWAFFYLGKICLEKDSVDFAQAEEYFNKASSKIKNKILKEASMLGLAKCYLDQGNEEKYFSELEKITQKFPHSFSAPDLFFEIAEHYYEKSESEKAEKYYKKIVDNYESSSVFHKAKRRLDE